MELFYSWIGAVLVFIIVEYITTTFYGLALALSAAITAMYVYLTGEATLSITQGVIFSVTSAVFAFFLPKLLISQAPDKPQ
jgi:membrane protein implicated in regulation of membrane protease activity